MKADLSEEIKAYNDFVEKGIKHGDKKKLANLKKAIKAKNNNSLKGINQYLHKVKFHKKGEKMEGGFLGVLAAMALRKYAWKGAKFLAKRAAKKVATSLANRAKEKIKKKLGMDDKRGDGFKMAGRSVEKPKKGDGFRMAGGSMEKPSRETHKHVQKYAHERDRPSYFIPTQRHVYQGGFNTGFLENNRRYIPKLKATQPGTGELNYFAYNQHHGSGFRHHGAGFKHGKGIYDAKILPNPNVRY